MPHVAFSTRASRRRTTSGRLLQSLSFSGRSYACRLFLWLKEKLQRPSGTLGQTVSQVGVLSEVKKWPGIFRRCTGCIAVAQ